MRVQVLPPTSVDVLIAEDDPLVRLSLRLLLEQQGYRCAEAENGLRAVDLALGRPPQCLMLDLAMPGLDGWAVARRLRADRRTAGVHINCLTGLADEGAREQARLAGCELVFTKPVDAHRLVEAVRRQVERTEAALASGLTKTQAEELLDWLEGHGCTGSAVALEEGGFGARFVYPAGLRPSEHGAGEADIDRPTARRLPVPGAGPKQGASSWRPADSFWRRPWR
jgi:CheY-like chemotaxis protein